ncbi:MAG: PD-(D/E)XK nuclease family protein [Endomicrobia bacterium]|nr:PD-(D/E)XK nuclease family protein [Endomicrobiia bacterium]
MNLEALLQQVFLISQKYDEIAERTGENFNIFNILRVSRLELPHSNVIAALLNPKEHHSKGNTFLKLFLKKLDINETEFSLENAKVKTEVTLDNGRVDIVIESGKKSIFIENKIDADDQNKQLERYYKHKPYKLFYLTLDGRDAREESAGNLEEGREYSSISYGDEILQWLKECLKESVNFPMLRETIQQYINLIKILTGQSRSVEMSNEIIDILLKDKDNYLTAWELRAVVETATERIIKEHFSPEVKKIADKHNLIVLDNNLTSKDKPRHSGFNLSDEKKQWTIRFQFEHRWSNGFLYGFPSSKCEHVTISLNENLDKYLRNKAQELGYKSSDPWWPLFKFMEPYENWTPNVYAELLNPNNEVLKKIEGKIIECLEIIKDYNSQVNY